MREIARIIDGVMVSPTGQRISDVRQLTESRAAPAPEPPRRNVQPIDAIDEFNSLLARAIKLAQGMNATDKSRASEVMEAARGALTMVTRLSSSEQRRFEAAMRAAARED